MSDSVHLTERPIEGVQPPAPTPSDDAEFEVMECFGEEDGYVFYAGTAGQRESAMAEAMLYASHLVADGGRAAIVEVTRAVVWSSDGRINPSF